MKLLDQQSLDLVERLKLEDEFFQQQFMMSYSGLNKLLYSPGAFYLHYVLKQKDDVSDKAMIEGKLIHCMILTPERLDDEFIILPSSFPSENPKKIIDRLYVHIKECYPEITDVKDTMLPYLENIENALIDLLKDENLYQSLKTDRQRLDKMLTEKNMEYLDFLLKKESKTVIDKPMLDFANKVREKFITDSTMRELTGMNEFDTQKVYNETEVAMISSQYLFGVRGFIDNLVIDHKEKVIRINDLKKSSKPLSMFADTIEYYKYWLQAAIYKTIIDNIKRTTYNVDYPVEFRFLVIDPYMHIAPFRISEETMTKYEQMTIDALHVADFHFRQKNFDLPHNILSSDKKEFVL
jgi:hypothetical protein